MTVVLAGGVGAARFLGGLIHVFPQKQITIIGNVGYDTEIHGLHISPDLDIVTYTLAGVVDPAKAGAFEEILSSVKRFSENMATRPGLIWAIGI